MCSVPYKVEAFCRGAVGVIFSDPGNLHLCRYKAALEKANYASLALKEEQEQEGTLGEDEEELQAVLARARRAAAAKAEADAAAEEGPSVARIAEEAARRRAAEEAQRAADAAEGTRGHSYPTRTVPRHNHSSS